jgi:hypothetical protein
MQKHAWLNTMEIGSKSIMKSMIDSKLAADGSNEEYQDKLRGS